MTRVPVWFLTLSIVFAFGSLCAAQADQDVAARRILLEQAQQAHVANDHARALDLAERAGRIEMTPSLRLFIANEQRALGQLTAAMGSADLCAREAEALPALRNRDEIIQQCREVTAVLRPQLGSITLAAPSPSPDGLAVTVAGATVPPALYGVPYPVAPGAVHIEATAPGRQTFRRDVTVAVGQNADIPLALPLAAGSSGSTSSSSQTASAHSSSVPQIVVIAGGAVVLLLSIPFYVLQQNALSACTPSGASEICDHGSIQSAQLWNGLTNGALAVGGVVLAVGAIWFIVSHVGGSHESPRAWLDVAPTPGGAVLTVGGAL